MTVKPASAIAYFRNGLGNLVQLTPALQALATQCDGGVVDMCLDSEWADSRRTAVVEMLAEMPFVGRVVEYPRETMLDRAQYRWWFWTAHNEPSVAAKLFESMSKGAHRVGWDRLLIAERDYYMEALRAYTGYAARTPLLFVPVANASVLPPQRFGAPVFALCNGSFGKMGTVKQWPYFADLSRALRRYYGAEVVLVGSGKELSDVPGDSYVGKLSITQTAKLLTECTVLVTVDTGLMHVADALGVPQVVVWGGTLISKNGPVSTRARILRAGLPCQPCQYTDRFETCATADCLRSVSVGEVLRAVRALLS